MHKAGALLSRRAYSRGELRGKLSGLPVKPEELEGVLDRLEELDLLNDAKYAYNFASNRIKEKGWGPLKVRHALLRRMVPAPTVESALGRVRSEAGDRPLLERYLERYWRTRKIPGNRDELRRLIGHLSRRGYRDELIVDVLRRAVPGEAWISTESD